MRYCRRYIIVFVIFTPFLKVSGQLSEPFTFQNTNTDCSSYYYSHDTVWVYTCLCKAAKPVMITGNDAIAFLNRHEKKISPGSPSFLKVHGNIQYDFTYRSFSDTPFLQKDFAQHSIQASIDLVVRDRYPVRLIVLNRRSNSPYFDDIMDVNMQYDKNMFINNLKEKIAGELPNTLNTNKLTEAEYLYKQKQWEVESLQRWVNHPARLQEIIQEKEGWLKNAVGKKKDSLLAKTKLNTESFNLPGEGKLNGIRDSLNKRIKEDSLLNNARDAIAKTKDQFSNRLDSLKGQIDSLAGTNKADSISGKFKVKAQYEEKQKELKKAQSELQAQRQKLNETKKSLQDSLNQLKKELARIKDPGELKDFINQHKLDAKELPKSWSVFSSINNIGLGRSWIDYSELTVKNISLTGINAEITPSRLYFAFAAGRVNYRFRDFVLKNSSQSKQSLYLVRAGIGKKEGNNLIFTWYDGKKDLLYSYGNPSATSALQKVSGISAESRLQLDANNYFILEMARSSYGAAGAEKTNKIWKLNDRSNEAYSIKANSFWPQTNTRITGYYRKTGEHFQSFNLQPINVNQEAYQLKVQQGFWKRKLLVEAGIRKNDFSNPFISPGVATSTVFKSLQASLRIRKYPFISAGYFPSSQLTVSENKTLTENQYNTLNVLVSHSYRVNKLDMTSNVVYLRFYNSGSDSGFIYYNASSWFVNQFFYLGNLRLQSGLTLTARQNLKVLMLEESAGYQLKKWLLINGSLKYNRLNHEQVLWGGSAGLGIMIKKLGTIQMNYDKSYFPGTQNNLLPMDMGRVTYIRTF